MILTTTHPAGFLMSRAEAVAADGFDLCLRAESVWAGLSDPPPPARRLLDPVQFGAALLPHLVILDILPPPAPAGAPDFRWRLFGTRHQAELGLDLTGRRLSELRPDWPGVAELHTIFEAGAASTIPVFFQLDYRTASDTSRVSQGVLMPLTDDSGRVGHLLGCSEWVRA
jgi:hypothetical protein